MGYSDSGTITLKLLAQDLASGNIAKFGAGLDTLAKRGGLVGSVLQGVGQSFGQMLNPLHYVEEGVGKVVDILGESLHAAEAEEAANARLDASLKANVASYDGNTEAIDRTIQSREKLGFTDIAQKDALVGLVAHTKDYSKALDIERVAMDLARFKQVDLGTAALVVGKAWDGNTTALKRMGIQLDKGAKGMDAMSGIEKVAGGQAEAFAGTLEGKQQSLGAAVEHLEAGIGKLVEGPATDLIGFFADLISTEPEASNAITDYTTKLGLATQALKDHGKAQKEDLTTAQILGGGYDKLASDLANFSGHILPQIQAADRFAIANKGLAVSFGVSADQMVMFYKTEMDAGKTAAQAQNDFADQIVLGQLKVGKSTEAVTTGSAAGYALVTLGLARYTDGWGKAGKAIPAYVAPAQGAVDTLTNHFEGGFKAIPAFVYHAVESVDHDLTALTDITKSSMHDTADAAKAGMKDIIWSLKHPLQEAHTEKFYRHEIKQGTDAMNRALKSGNAEAYAKAVKFVADMKAKLAELSGIRFTVQASMDFLTKTGGIGGLGADTSGYGRYSQPTSNSGGNSFGVGTTGGGGIHVHFHGIVAAPGPADAQRIGNIIGPIVARHLQSSGHL